MSIDVSAITGAASRAASGSTATSGSTAAASDGTLDKQAFLDLLVAQLRNQDPTSPMDSSQLMAQTTQLGMMEQLTDMSRVSRESFALQMRMAAAGLVGHVVTWTGSDEATRTGVVEAVSYAGSVPTVTVGGEQVPLDAVTSVTAATPAAATATSATATSTPTAS